MYMKVSLGTERLWWELVGASERCRGLLGTGCLTRAVSRVVQGGASACRWVRSGGGDVEGIGSGDDEPADEASDAWRVV